MDSVSDAAKKETTSSLDIKSGGDASSDDKVAGEPPKPVSADKDRKPAKGKVEGPSGRMFEELVHTSEVYSMRSATVFSPDSPDFSKYFKSPVTPDRRTLVVSPIGRTILMFESPGPETPSATTIAQWRRVLLLNAFKLAVERLGVPSEAEVDNFSKNGKEFLELKDTNFIPEAKAREWFKSSPEFMQQFVYRQLDVSRAVKFEVIDVAGIQVKKYTAYRFIEPYPLTTQIPMSVKMIVQTPFQMVEEYRQLRGPTWDIRPPPMNIDSTRWWSPKIPEPANDVISLMCIGSEGVREQLFRDMVSTLKYILSLRATDKFSVFKQLTLEIRPIMTEINTLNSLAANVVQSAAEALFIQTAAATALWRTTAIVFRPNYNSIADPITMLGCLTYLTMLPGKVMDPASVDMCKAYIYRNWIAQVQVRWNNGVPQLETFPNYFGPDILEAGFKSLGSSANAPNLGNGLRGLASLTAIVDDNAYRGRTYGSYEEFEAGWALGPGNPIYDLFHIDYARRIVPDGSPGRIMGIEMMYPFATEGMDEAHQMGRLPVLVNFMRAMATTDFSRSTSRELMGFKALGRMIESRHKVIYDYMKSMTMAIQAAQKLGLDPRAGEDEARPITAYRVQIQLSSSDLFSFATNVSYDEFEVKKEIVNAYKTWKTFKWDMNTALVLLSRMDSGNNQTYLNIQNKAERDKLFNELLDITKDWFAGKMWRSYIPVVMEQITMNPGIVDDIFIPAFLDCYSKINDKKYLERVGLSFAVDYLVAADVHTDVAAGLDYASFSDEALEAENRFPVTAIDRFAAAYTANLSGSTRVVADFPWVKFNNHFDTDAEAKEPEEDAKLIKGIYSDENITVENHMRFNDYALNVRAMPKNQYNQRFRVVLSDYPFTRLTVALFAPDKGKTKVEWYKFKKDRYTDSFNFTTNVRIADNKPITYGMGS